MSTVAAHGGGWNAVRLKFFSSRLYGLSQPPEYLTDGIPFVRATNVSRGKLVRQGLVFVSHHVLSESRAVALVSGDIIVVRSGAYTGDSALVTSEWVGAVAGFDIVLRVTRYADPRFVAFSLLSPTVLDRQIRPLSARAAQSHLNAEELGDVELLLPSLAEQRAIADYLDQETARIDALIAAKERLLELRAEKRRALITGAVTRGLDSSVAFRDSGVPWLGRIPAHWNVIALRFLAAFGSGATPDTGTAELWEGSIPWVSPKDMKVEVIKDAQDHVNDLALSETALRLYPPGAVLIVVRGMILSHSFPVAVNSAPVTINQDMKAFIPNGKMSTEFLFYYVRGNDVFLINFLRFMWGNILMMKVSRIILNQA